MQSLHIQSMLSENFEYINHQDIMAFFLNILLVVGYFFTFYFSNWWFESVISLIIPILIMTILFKIMSNKITRRHLIFFAPAAIFCGLLNFFNASNYIGASIELSLRKAEFEHEIETSMKNDNQKNEWTWPAWNSNAINMRDFVFAKDGISKNLAMPSESSDCKKIITKLNKNYYETHYIGCGGPLF